MTSTIVQQDEAVIRDLLAARAAAFQAKDPEALVAQLAADAVSFDLAPPLRHAGPALLDPDNLRRWFATFEGPLGYETTELSVTVGGDVAFCHSLTRLSATPAGSTDSFELWFRSTTGLAKIDGSWLVTHEHTSTPFYMDGSFRAATDLKP